MKNINYHNHNSIKGLSDLNAIKFNRVRIKLIKLNRGIYSQATQW